MAASSALGQMLTLCVLVLAHFSESDMDTKSDQIKLKARKEAMSCLEDMGCKLDHEDATMSLKPNWDCIIWLNVVGYEGNVKINPTYTLVSHEIIRTCQELGLEAKGAESVWAYGRLNMPERYATINFCEDRAGAIDQLKNVVNLRAIPFLKSRADLKILSDDEYSEWKREKNFLRKYCISLVTQGRINECRIFLEDVISNTPYIEDKEDERFPYNNYVRSVAISTQDELKACIGDIGEP